MEQKSILNYMGGGNKRKLTSVTKNEKSNEKVDDSKADNGEPSPKHQKIDEAAKVDKMEILGMPITNSKWIQLLQPEFQKPYFKTISDRLQSDFNSKIAIFPPKKLVFQALNSCSIENVINYYSYNTFIFSSLSIWFFLSFFLLFLFSSFSYRLKLLFLVKIPIFKLIKRMDYRMTYYSIDSVF